MKSEPSLEPYLVLFPLGVLFAILGAVVWPLYVLGRLPYPALLHLSLMIQGFELCFVLGFLLTAMPAFTHAERCRPWELAWAVAAVSSFGVAHLAGLAAAAQAAFLASLLLIVTAGVRRVAGNRQKPPEELLFVAFGVGLGIVGSALLLANALGAGVRLPARFAERLLSLGMILSLVMGVGSLLVPTFAGMRDPLTIPGVAGPHQRRGRRWFYAAVIAGFALAFGAELVGRPGLGGALRAVAATVMGLWVWKLTRLPRRDVPGFVLWASGWMVLAGLWVTACFPRYALAGLHVTFIGGFAALTMGIATRVLVAHGGHALAIERRVLDSWLVTILGLALALRVAADLASSHTALGLAFAGAVWILAWGWWGARVLPYLRHRLR